jgi:hypothetical protein
LEKLYTNERPRFTKRCSQGVAVVGNEQDCITYDFKPRWEMSVFIITRHVYLATHALYECQIKQLNCARKKELKKQTNKIQSGTYRNITWWLALSAAALSPSSVVCFVDYFSHRDTEK